MVDAEENESGPISIDEHSADLGLKAPQMDATERAKFWLARWVLLFGTLLMLVAWALKVSINWGLPDVGACGPGSDECDYAMKLLESRKAAADSIFEFAKTWIPPIITLVPGYYFARETANQDDSDNV